MRVLYLTHRLPYAPNRGDRIRAYHTLRALAGHADVELVSLLHEREEQAALAGMHELADRVHGLRTRWLRSRLAALLALAGPRPLTHVLLDAPGIRSRLARIVARRRPDVVLALCTGMARFALEPPLASIPWVLDMVDVDSEKWRALGERTRGPMGWIYRREARTLARFEALAARCAHRTLVVTDRERRSLARLAPEARIEVVENGIELAHFRNPAPPAASSEIVFCGVMDYAPNHEAAVWFATEVLPRVRRSRPEATFRVVGMRPRPELVRLAARDPAITVTGAVDDVRPELWRAAVSVAPLMTARGVQNKVLEALAAGLPCVVSPAVAAGLPTALAPFCAVADSAERFAEATTSLLALSPAERRERVRTAPLAAYDWAQRLAPLVASLAEAAATRPA
ncbi:MAG: TIGR03087 family PEP-CTERM/XrtA system glycosyltransferase [Planctomycetota bacterium]|nr:MAG: TIGR03087 family PEP-CTERM/XrtA system glycosyltransferase [Planctomycetota bacterium]